MVVGVAALVGAVLGAVAYDYSTQQTEALTAELVMRQASMDERAIEKIQSDAEAEDRKVLGSIVGGVLLLCLVLAVTGVFVTHRVVGPAYKMRKLLREVARGRLRFQGKLRKGDELQELFEAFSGMVASLRERQAEEVAMLDEAIARARSAGAPEDAVREVVAVRERMKEALD
jgi:nitrogen fixation/metabolism regulation signal transduction histidine kinase